MIPTWIGLVQIVIGLVLLVRGSVATMLIFTLVCGLFNGSASVLLPALGGSSIPPVQFALLFLFLRIAFQGRACIPAMVEAIRANGLLVIFVLYGVAIAIAGPRIFAGTMNVAPMRFIEIRDPFGTVPLEPTSQNVTNAVYLLGTLLMAVLGHMAVRAQGGTAALVRGGIIVSWAHIVTGLLGVAAHGTPAEIVFDLIRNGAYAQLDNSYQGFIRINGVLAEASIYAAIGLSWLFFNFELWWRGVLPRQTGPAAFALAVVLIFSTSSTAYVGLGCYAAFIIVRCLVFPIYVPVDKLIALALSAVALAAIVSVAMLVQPSLFYAIVDMIRHMTVDKSDSLSGRQRLFWATQGWDAFIHSYGLGIGPGSFRSSSIIMAIMGSMGLIGLVTFFGYMWKVLAPTRASTWARVEDPYAAVSAAAGCAALAMIVPAAIGAPSPNPGIGFAAFAAAALALRPKNIKFTHEQIYGAHGPVTT